VYDYALWSSADAHTWHCSASNPAGDLVRLGGSSATGLTQQMSDRCTYFWYLRYSNNRSLLNIACSGQGQHCTAPSPTGSPDTSPTNAPTTAPTTAPPPPAFRITRGSRTGSCTVSGNCASSRNKHAYFPRHSAVSQTKLLFLTLLTLLTSLDNIVNMVGSDSLWSTPAPAAGYAPRTTVQAPNRAPNRAPPPRTTAPTGARSCYREYRNIGRVLSPGVECGGEPIPMLADGTPSGWVGFGPVCQQRCSSDPVCNAYVHQFDGACLWQYGVTEGSIAERNSTRYA